MELSIIVPAYNEGKNLPQFLKRIEDVRPHNVNFELIIIDNNSTDNTQEVLSEIPMYARVIMEKKPGYGSAIKCGLRNATGKWVCWTHADLQVDPYTIFEAYFIRKENFYIKGQRYGRSFADNFFTIGMSLLESILFQKKLWDINAQPNMVEHSNLPLIDTIPDDFSLDLYMYTYLKQKKIIRFPTYFGPRFAGKSSWNTGFKSRLKFIKRTLQYSWKLRWK